MSADAVSAAPGRGRALAVAVLLALLTALGPALAGAGPARASEAGTTAGERIAASLRTSPLYVDPSLSSVFPPAVRTSLLRQMRAAKAPVYVLAVPLAAGGTWSSGDQLATVVHNYLGKPGIYLTTDANMTNDIGAYTWPSDPDGTDAAPYHAADAAQAANIAPDLEQAALPGKFSRCLTLIASGRAVSAYQAEARALNASYAPRTPAASSGGSGGGTGPGLYAVIAVLIVALGGGGALVTRRRRRRRPSAPFVTPHSVFTTARNATEAELRDVAQQQVIRLGELVEQPSSSDQGDAQVARALDAYEAAGKALDAARGIPDLAGVLVLTHTGTNAIAAARALQSGQPEPPAHPLCFFNPLHGEGRRDIRWRALGSRQTLDVSVCAECADATGRHRLPEVLKDTDGDREIPYYEADPDRSVWAATGYGQFGDDLARRIITRGLR